MHQNGRSAKFNTRISNVHVDAAILGREEWRRIKKESVHLTAAQIVALQQEEDARRKQTMKSIKRARTSLLEAEAAKQAYLKVQATQREMDERELALEIAEGKANEDLDQVKTMNTEMICARARTIRDGQLAQNRMKLAAENAQLEAEAQMLENGRLHAVAIYAERERALAAQRRQGGAVIVAQMEERKRNAALDRERREREKEEMMRANLLAQDEERRLAEERKNRSHDFLLDCLAANAAVFRRKQREKERNIEEAQMMVEYQKEKAAREDEYERQQRELKAQKEREVSELRKKQQRAIDTQAEVDALRARRIEEEKERLARQRETDDIRKTQEIRLEMQEDRAQSVALKHRRLVEMAKIEKAEFDRVSAAQREARAKERAAEAKRLRENAEYRADLKEEMAKRAAERQLQPIINLDEQKHMEELNDDYVARLERIRQMKLAKLREEGVPDKYLADLARMPLIVK
jgi:hypothetical protein